MDTEKEKQFHKEKAAFHEKAAEFFEDGKMPDRASFQRHKKEYHEDLAND